MTIAVADRPTIGLGTQISGAPSFEEVLRHAGLDWGVKVVTPTPHGEVHLPTEDGGSCAVLFPRGAGLVVREDTGQVLGSLVGQGYTPINNYEALGLAVPLMEAGARVTRAGAVAHGARVFLELDLPEGNDQIKIGGHDPVKVSMALTSGHGGAAGLTAELRATRLVCTNGLHRPLPGSETRITIRHTSGAGAARARATELLSQAWGWMKDLRDAAEILLATPMPKEWFLEYLTRLWDEEPPTTPRQQTARAAREAQLLRLFEQSDTTAGIAGTAWAAYNAVTEWQQWYAPVRPPRGETEADARARRAHDTATAAFSRRAWALAA